MMTQKMFIPSKIRVGFQKRSDTYTGKLSYVIYYDEKGKIRKEASWNSWCDAKQGVLEIDNVPQTGYIFNKGVQRDGYWGSGRSVVRVYDPRDFEFEISVDNLMGILMHSDVSKRDIVESCVFAWYGSELVLLPVNSVDYQASLEYTANQSKSIGKKDMMEGYHYLTKKGGEDYIYIGFLDWWEWKNSRDNRYGHETHTNTGKKHVFWDGHNFITKTLAVFSECVENSLDENYAKLRENFYKTIHSQAIKSVKIKSKKYTKKSSNYYYGHNYLTHVHDNKCYIMFVQQNWGEENKAERVEVNSLSQFTFGESLTKEPLDNPYLDRNYYSRNTTGKLPAHLKEFEGEKKTLEQWYEVLSEKNSGRLFYVLENGKEVDSERY